VTGLQTTTCLLAHFPYLPDKGILAMLTSDQINELHRMYVSEKWPIRKIERHLNMGCRTIKKYLLDCFQAEAEGQRLGPPNGTRAKRMERAMATKILLPKQPPGPCACANEMVLKL
jgi:hypothetical protein